MKVVLTAWSRVSCRIQKPSWFPNYKASSFEHMSILPFVIL